MGATSLFSIGINNMTFNGRFPIELIEFVGMVH